VSAQLATYMDARGEPRAALQIDGHIYDWASALERFDPVCHERLSRASSVLGLLQHWDVAARVLDELADKIYTLDIAPRSGPDTQLLAPVLYPPAVFCSGPNYTCHLAEMTGGQRTDIDKRVTRPFFFTKPAAHTIIGPGAPIELPRLAAKLDWEAELAVVIGKPAYEVGVERAMEHVAGYTIINDLSARDLFQRDDWPMWKDWLACKGFTGAAPLGPTLVPANQIADPHNLRLQLWVNEQLHQNSSTARMVFSIAEQIAFLSERVALRPGDVIATGTPAGVGMAKGVFLQPGDRVRIEIEGLGALENPVTARGARRTSSEQ
jgi:2,4-didehydro-3-deoxy-L-rhamnonate hydrolase